MGAGISDFEDDLIRQRLHMDAVYEALNQMRSHSIPIAERDRHLTYALERIAEYRDLVERMLRYLDSDHDQIEPDSVFGR